MNLPQPTSEQSTLIFLHVPKTAGVTFRSILAGLYPNATHCIYQLAQGVVDFQQQPVEQRAALSVLQGHFAYGIHQYIPGPVRYITFLRNPVERVISLYYFLKRDPANYLHRTIVDHQITLADFLNEPITSEIYNFHVRAIAGTDDLDPTVFPKTEPSAVDLAKRRLANDFSAFGLTENFDASLVLFSRALGWRLLSPKMFYRSENVAPERRPLSMIAPEIIDAIRRYNQLDLELYDYAVKLFRARWTSDRRLQLQFHQFQRARNIWLEYQQRVAR